MNTQKFDNFFTGAALSFLHEAIDIALREDGQDLTSINVFPQKHHTVAVIVAKEDTLVAGLPIIPLILEKYEKYCQGQWQCEFFVSEGDLVKSGAELVRISGTTSFLLGSERIILNFIAHLSGIANLVRLYVQELAGTQTKLLDTRKTLPGLRYPEKYAVLIGGGANHRKNLEEMLMLKDNHIDAAGGITAAVKMLRTASHVPIEVECRNLAEVQEAVSCNVQRVMFDNMDTNMVEKALPLVPENIEVEISGGITLDNIGSFAKVKSRRKPNFISVGRLTHSAVAADFSMRTNINV